MLVVCTVAVLACAPSEDFVFQPSTGLCVLLPEVAASEIVKMPNSQVVSGTVTMAILRQETITHGECVFTPGSGYTMGDLGVAVVPPGQKPITTKQDCCDACMAEARCAKFSFRPDSGQCHLFESLAEEFSTDGLISGILSARYLAAGGHATGIAAGQAAIARGNSGGVVRGDSSPTVGYSLGDHWPPQPPALTAAESPPPLPPPDATSLTQSVMSAVSLGLGGLMLTGFVMCAYCFFSQDLKQMLGISTAPAGFVAPGGSAVAALKKGKKGKKGKKAPGEEEVSVTCQTPAITQTKDVPLADCHECADLLELVSMLAEVFPAVMRDHRKERLLLQCRLTLEKASRAAKAAAATASGGAEPSDGWMLVCPDSDLSQVLASCPALRLVERPKEFREESYVRAFVPAAAVGSEGGSGKRARAKRAAAAAANATAAFGGKSVEGPACGNGGLAGGDVAAAPPPKRKGGAKGGTGSLGKSRSGDDVQTSLLAAAEEDDDEAYERAAERAAAEAAQAAQAAAAVAAEMAAAAAARRREKAGGARQAPPGPACPPQPHAGEGDPVMATRAPLSSSSTPHAATKANGSRHQREAPAPLLSDQAYEAQQQQRRSMARSSGMD